MLRPLWSKSLDVFFEYGPPPSLNAVLKVVRIASPSPIRRGRWFSTTPEQAFFNSSSSLEDFFFVCKSSFKSLAWFPLSCFFLSIFFPIYFILQCLRQCNKFGSCVLLARYLVNVLISTTLLAIYLLAEQALPLIYQLSNLMLPLTWMDH